MLKLSDACDRMSGKIQTFLHRNGSRIFLCNKSNVITYTGADLLAEVMAGDSSSLPRHVGFLYGTAASPTLDDPDTMPASTKRIHDWAKVTADATTTGGNVLVAPLAALPSLTLDGDSLYYTNNAAVFGAHTGAVLEYAFPTTGAVFAATIPELDALTTPVYIYHVILLCRTQVGSTVTYRPFARSAVGTDPFEAKPASFDFGVYWTISFR